MPSGGLFELSLELRVEVDGGAFHDINIYVYQIGIYVYQIGVNGRRGISVVVVLAEWRSELWQFTTVLVRTD